MTPHRMSGDAAGHALGALGGEEQLAMERALAGSPALLREVEAFREVAALLALAAPSLAPPDGLRDRIVSQARQVQPLVTAPAPSPGRAPAPGWVRRAAPWLALAASLAGLVVLGGRVRGEHEARLGLQQENADLQARVASLDSVVTTLLAPDVETVKLSATGAPPTARLYWNTRSRRVVLAAFALPPAVAGRAYQLWGIETGKAPVSLGVFNTDADGTGRASFAVPAGLRIAVGAVTEEPAGGSPQPTTPAFLVGQLRTGE
jgi:anti-sigma-K factor RskA